MLLQLPVTTTAPNPPPSKPSPPASAPFHCVLVTSQRALNPGEAFRFTLPTYVKLDLREKPREPASHPTNEHGKFTLLHHESNITENHPHFLISYLSKQGPSTCID